MRTSAYYPSTFFAVFCYLYIFLGFVADIKTEHDPSSLCHGMDPSQ